MAYGGDRDHDAICAVSTPSGVGGVAIIRLSGSQAFSIGRKIAAFLPPNPESHKIYFGTLLSLENATPIDEVLLSCFHHGKSYTGEETLEISCHGSPAITQWILQELILSGARIAERGEFSYRAFINGKIDLVQAEGVLELVESQSKRAAQQGLRQLKGGLSKQLKSIQSDLLYILANIEAAIDFSTEDIDVINKTELLHRSQNAERGLRQLLATYEQGRLLTEGLCVAMSGAPNVGKSSLFNLLLEEDRSIVTHLPGTTRDVVEAALMLDGIRVAFLDTAGIRHSSDLVEQLGIQRSRDSHASADVVLFLFDASQGMSDEEFQMLQEMPLEKVILLGNKVDKAGKSSAELSQELATKLSGQPNGKIFKTEAELHSFLCEKVLFISTLEHKLDQSLEKNLGKNFRGLVLNALKSFLHKEKLEDEAVISQARHFNNLSHALEKTSRAAEALIRDEQVEFVALDLKEALVSLQETLGERFDDQIMDYVFKQFCIGK